MRLTYFKSFMTSTSNQVWNTEKIETIDKLESLIDLLVSTAAIKTVNYYNLEFHNEVDYKFMNKFKSYGKDGFTNISPAEYLEAMIRSDKRSVKVLLNPPKTYITKSVPAERLNAARLQYTHMIEPRKVAHQIVTVRDDISGELEQDLICLQCEHEETERVCQACLTQSREAAEKSRRAGYSVKSGSTPYRAHTYFETSSLVSIKRKSMTTLIRAVANDIGIRFCACKLPELPQSRRRCICCPYGRGLRGGVGNTRWYVYRGPTIVCAKAAAGSHGGNALSRSYSRNC